MAEKKPRRWIIWVVVGAVAAILLGHLLWPKPEVVIEPEMIEFPVERTTLALSVGATGTLEPAQRADLSFSSPGTVNAVNVNVGDKVSAGQVLASIGLVELQEAVESAQAEVTAASTDLQTARKNGEKTAIEAAESTLKVKENALTNARRDLENGTMRAPFDGSVALVGIKVGDAVNGGTAAENPLNGIDLSQLGLGGYPQANPAQNTSTGSITVITADKFTVNTTVSGTDVGNVAKGMPVKVIPDGTLDEYTGTVRSVGVIATTSQQTGYADFPVVIDIVGEHPELFAGISAQLEIQYELAEDVLALPISAVQFDEQGKEYVQVRVNGEVVKKPVTVGIAEGMQIEIVSGLQPGEMVLVPVFPDQGGMPDGPNIDQPGVAVETKVR